MNKRIVAAMAAVALAIVGTVMLINYASGANERAYGGAKLESVLQVTEPIAANTKSEDLATKVKTVELPKSAIAKDAVKDLSDLAGLLTTTDLHLGEQVLTSRFAKENEKKEVKPKFDIPKGTQEVSIPMAGARAVAGTLKVGDLVGIIASYQSKEGDGVTQFIRNRVPITQIDSAAVVEGADPAAASQLITIAVKTRDAGKIINAIEFGKVWLTKQNADTEPGNGGSISRNDVTG